MFTVLGGDRKEYGPVTADEVRRWIVEGRLNGQSQLKPTGGQWITLSSLPEFADALQAQAGQPGVAQSASPPPLDPAVWSAQILARQPQFQIGRCLSRSWTLLKVNFGVLFGAAFLIWLIALAGAALPILLHIMGVIPAFVAAAVLGLIYWVISGPLHGGLYLVYLKRIRGQPTSATAAFAGFGPLFAQLLLTGVVVSVLSGLGCACILPWIYLLVAWIFSIPLVADKRLEFWSAMELSRKVVTRVWFPMLGLLIVAYLPFIITNVAGQIHGALVQNTGSQSFTLSEPLDIGHILQMVSENYRADLWFVAVQLVLLLNLPFALGALMYAYEDLFGPHPSSVGQASSPVP